MELLVLVLLAVAGGVGLVVAAAALFFRNRIGDRLGDFPLLLAGDPVKGAIAPEESFSGEGDDPAPVAEFRLEFVMPTVVSK